MQIAICDDEKKELLQLKELVLKYDSTLAPVLFTSAEELLEDIKNCSYDLVLLDIEMDGINGYEAAKRLVKTKNPPLVVFITNSGEYTYRGYEVAFRYLPKPVTYEVLEKTLSDAIDKLAPYKFTVNSNGRLYIIPINEIRYFESSGHKLLIHTKTGDFECRMKLVEVESLLPGSAFARPYKSYLVNLDYVNTAGENELTLVGGERIQISRRCKRGFEQALFRFVRRQ